MKLSGCIKTELIPASDYDMEKKSYSWSLARFDEDTMEIKFTFDNPELISMNGQDKIKITFIKTNYYMRPQDESKKAVPSGFETVIKLPA